MSANAKIVEHQRKFGLTNDEIELFKESFIIVPYETSGFLDYTNKGVSDYVVQPQDFETFKRIWTGNDACVLNWKNSLYLQQNNETNEMEVKFQLGEVFCGVLETNTQSNNIGKDVSYSEYTSQEIETTYTFRVHKTFNLNDYYQLLFYKIPEISKSTLFRIVDIEKDYIGRELAGYVITFKSVNQEFANTGRARQQNITPNSPGQGYIECVVTRQKPDGDVGKDYYEFFDRYITIDKDKIRNNPCRKVVVKMLGAGTLNSFTMFGRPVLLGDTFEKYRPQRLLFPYNFQTPTTPTLFHTQANTTNMYFGEFWPTLQYYQEFLTFLKNNLGVVNELEYQGFLEYNYKKLQATNPVENGHYKYDLYGYLDTNVSPVEQKQWEFNMEQKIIDTAGIYGTEQQYRIGGTKKLHDHLFDNFWTQKNIKVLPVDTKTTLDFGPTLISGINTFKGGGLNNIIGGGVLTTIGFIGTLINKLSPRTLNSFRGIVSAPLIDYNNGLFNGNKIPFNMINNGSSDAPNNIFFCGNTTSTSFSASITDLFVSERVKNSDGTYKTLSTINIGQTQFENGENILSTGQEFLLNGDAKILETYDDYSGYIIDGFKLQAVFNGEISVEFLDINDDVIWSGIYQSEAKWTNSMREIWTERNTSVFGRENVFFSQPLPYPKPIPPPPPSFFRGVRKDIPLDESVRLFNRANFGGGYEWMNLVKNETLKLSGQNWWTIKNKNFEKTNQVLLANTSKDELLQVYSHIKIKVGNQEFNVSMFEIFSNPNNEWILEKDFSTVGSTYYNVALGETFLFPTWLLNSTLYGTSHIKARFYFENNTLKYDIYGELKDIYVGFNFICTFTQLKTYFVFSKVELYLDAGISQLTLFPKG